MTSSNLMSGAPVDHGFIMPPEWSVQKSMWFSWAHNPETWPGHLDQVQKPYAEMVAAFSRFQRVDINVPSAEWKSRALVLLRKAKADLDQVHFHLIPTNDSWVRDHGPLFLVGKDDAGKKALADFRFNSWGEKYPPWNLDNQVPEKMADELGMKRFESSFILEGGSIDHNGDGVLLTTEDCLLNRNRNPDFSRADIEGQLKEWLGVRSVYWLGEGIIGDDTDGHVDDITRFVNAGMIVTAVEKKPGDDNYRPLMENRERLDDVQLADGSRPAIVELPMPDPVVFRGDRLPASYANFTIANGVVVVPVFKCEADGVALGILGELFPDREIVGIDARMLVLGLGAVHCLTQQQPE